MHYYFNYNPETDGAVEENIATPSGVICVSCWLSKSMKLNFYATVKKNAVGSPTGLGRTGAWIEGKARLHIEVRVEAHPLAAGQAWEQIKPPKKLSGYKFPFIMLIPLVIKRRLYSFIRAQASFVHA